jgi:hypothetical protein
MEAALHQVEIQLCQRNSLQPIFWINKNKLLKTTCQGLNQFSLDKDLEQKS